MTKRSLMLSLMVFSLSACAPGPTREAEEFTSATAAYLGKKWGMTPLANGDAQTGTVGGLHAIKGLRSSRSLGRNSNSVFLAPVAAPANVATTTVRSENYVIGETLSREIAVNLKPNLAAQGIDVSAEALASSLRSMNATFTVEKQQAYLQTINNAIKTNSYQQESIPSGYQGLVVPHESLVITNFQYSGGNTTTKEGEIAANYLKLFEAGFTVKSTTSGGVVTVRKMPVHVAVTLTPVKMK
jgi:hypothetical protein